MLKKKLPFSLPTYIRCLFCAHHWARCFLMLLELSEPAFIRKLQTPSLNYQRNKRGWLVGRIVGYSHIWKKSCMNNDWDPTQNDWLHFLYQFPPVARGRSDGIFQAHFFPVSSSPKSKGCLHVNPKQDSYWLKLIIRGFLWPIPQQRHDDWPSQVTCSSFKQVGGLNWLATFVRTKSYGKTISQIKGDSFLMKGVVLGRQNDEFVVSFWMPLSSLWEWIWEIINISVKVKMTLVLNIKDTREI